MIRQQGWRVAFPERTFATVDHIVPTNELVEPYKDPLAQAMMDADDPDRTEGTVFRYGVRHVSTNGVTGYPSRASKSMGLELWRDVVAAARDVVERAHSERAPLG